MVATEHGRAALLASEEDARRAWDLAVAAVPPSARERSVADGHTVKDLVAHMAAWERWSEERLAARMEGRPPLEIPDWHAYEHAFNVRLGERWRDEPWDVVAAEATAAYAAFRARLERLDGEQLVRSEGLIRATGSRHYAEYLGGIHELLDRLPPLVSFETARLRLRSLRPSDAQAIFEMFGDPEVMRYIPPSPNALTVERVRRGIERRMALERESGLTLWLVERKDTGEMIGQCGFALVEGTGPDVEIAYHYVRRAWGHGYATEAAVACLRRGFAGIGLERAIAICYPENVASWRVMEKAGMTLDGEGDYYGIRMKRYIADRATWRSPRGSS